MVNRYLKNSKNIINLGLIIIWMCFIFLMSNQPAAASDSQSLGIINILSKMGIDMNGIFGDIANFIVRKCAHFLEYMILGFLIINLLKNDFKFQYILLIAVIGNSHIFSPPAMLGIKILSPTLIFIKIFLS